MTTTFNCRSYTLASVYPLLLECRVRSLMTVQLRSLGSTPNSSKRIPEPALLRPLNPNYVTGLIDAEGSFNITISRDENRTTGHRVVCEMHVTQKSPFC
jgi:hypothetical protein